MGGGRNWYSIIILELHFNQGGVILSTIFHNCLLSTLVEYVFFSKSGE